MNPHKAIQSQYPAVLAMLEQVIVKCPQQHTGEVYERLGTQENIELHWVSSS
jgi:hypothetical protein